MLSPDQLERRNYFLNALCRHTVRVAKRAGNSDAWGNEDYGDPVEYQARVEDVSKLIQVSNGQMQVAGGKITFAMPAPVIDTDDQIEVPTVDTVDFPTGYKKIGQIMDIKQDETGDGQQATVVYY